MIFFYKLLSSFSLNTLYKFSDFLFFFIHKFYRRNIVITNLQKSFPEYSKKKINDIANHFYKNFSDVVFETIKSLSISKKEILDRVLFKNSEKVLDKISKNENIVFLTSHACNWEWLLLSSELKLKCKINVVYKKLSNRRFNKMMLNSRSRFGSVLIESKKLIKVIKSTKNKSNVWAIVADQSPTKKNKIEWINFLNQNTAFFKSVEYIPRLLNSTIYFAKMKRNSRGKYTVEFVEICSNEDINSSTLKLFASILENQIKSSPEEWLWSHKRWKLTK